MDNCVTLATAMTAYVTVQSFGAVYFQAHIDFSITMDMQDLKNRNIKAIKRKRGCALL
jgi:hypothetical protein